MIIIALAAALMLDASPKLETVAKLTAREAPAQENYAAPILAVAVTLECTARATGQVETAACWERPIQASDLATLRSP